MRYEIEQNQDEFPHLASHRLNVGDHTDLINFGADVLDYDQRGGSGKQKGDSWNANTAGAYLGNLTSNHNQAHGNYETEAYELNLCKWSDFDLEGGLTKDDKHRLSQAIKRVREAKIIILESNLKLPVSLQENHSF